VDKTGEFHPDALRRAKECLTEFKREIDRHQVDRILAMATSAARDAKNGEELFKIGKELGIPIEIIPGADEARITFAGATEGELKGNNNVAVIDVGGGSTEFIVGNKTKLYFAKSLNIGAVRLTEKFITQQPIPKTEREAVEKYIDEQIATIIPSLKAQPIEEILAVAGTPSALAVAVIGKFDPEKVQGFILDQATLKKWCDLVASTTVEEKIQKYHLEPGRADVIFSGATILHRFLVQIEKPFMKVSIKGVRYGVALEALSRN
jgi:exopolyphosphatase/guanosine-5'-triphosphate,3'-diphosphate pyrophosphatase